MRSIKWQRFGVVLDLLNRHVVKNVAPLVTSCLPLRVTNSEAIDFVDTNLGSSPDIVSIHAINLNSPSDDLALNQARTLAQSPCLAVTSVYLCRFCGCDDHPRNVCPARRHNCSYCDLRGHFSEVCEKRISQLGVSSFGCQSVVPALSRTMIPITVNGFPVKALVDTGSTESFVDNKLAVRLKLTKLTLLRRQSA